VSEITAVTTAYLTVYGSPIWIACSWSPSQN